MNCFSDSKVDWDIAIRVQITNMVKSMKNGLDLTPNRIFCNYSSFIE